MKVLVFIRHFREVNKFLEYSKQNLFEYEMFATVFEKVTLEPNLR